MSILVWFPMYITIFTRWSQARYIQTHFSVSSPPRVGPKRLKDGQTDRRMNIQTHSQTDSKTNRQLWTDGRTDSKMERCTNRQKGRLTDRWKDRTVISIWLKITQAAKLRKVATNREADKKITGFRHDVFFKNDTNIMWKIQGLKSHKFCNCKLWGLSSRYSKFMVSKFADNTNYWLLKPRNWQHN